MSEESYGIICPHCKHEKMGYFFSQNDDYNYSCCCESCDEYFAVEVITRSPKIVITKLTKVKKAAK